MHAKQIVCFLSPSLCSISPPLSPRAPVRLISLPSSTVWRCTRVPWYGGFMSLACSAAARWCGVETRSTQEGNHFGTWRHKNSKFSGFRNFHLLPKHQEGRLFKRSAIQSTKLLILSLSCLISYNTIPLYIVRNIDHLIRTGKSNHC